jgi:hypothetical protein
MTSALSIIRPFAAEDEAALNDSARRFAERHCLKGLDWGLMDRPWESLDAELWSRGDNCSDTAHLKRLWQACRCRALGVPVAADIAVAYGYVGRRAS